MKKKKNSDMGINFIFDEELEKSKKELQQVINTLEEDTETKRKSELLKTFARAVALSLKKHQEVLIKQIIMQSEMKRLKPKMHEQLLDWKK